MAELVVVENVSLDGVAQAPGRPDEDPRGGFRAGGWAMEVLAGDPEAAMASMSSTSGDGAMLLGRRTYLDLVGHWLSTPEPNPFAELLARTPKYVATRDDGAELPYPQSIRLDGEGAETVAALKQRLDGELVVLGSLQLVQALAGADLVDRYVLTTVPVLLGGGTRLFDSDVAPGAPGRRARLTLEQSQSFASGVQVSSYRVLR